MIKNLFLDRDGIINEVVLRDGKPYSPRTFEEFSFREDFLRFYKSLNGSGVNLFVVSNQPDIARGHMPAAELQKMTDAISRCFKIKEILYCEHDDVECCNCRKPKPGMINRLLEKYKLQKSESIMVGDSAKDMEAGRNAGIVTVLLECPYNAEAYIECDFKVKSLTEIQSLRILGG